MEKERILAPPRSAVPVPGSRSVFGRGFFRRLRASQGGGCMLLVFMSVGAAIFLFGVAGTVGPYRDGLRENGDPRFFYAAMAFGTVFFLVALRMLQLVLTGAENEGRGKGRNRDEPWTWDHPWRKEWMAPDYTGGGSGTVLGRVAFLALLGLFNVVWASPSLFLKILVSVFDLFGLLILYDSLQKLVQWLRFRHPVVIWATFPAFLGERLEGRVAFARRVHAAGPPRLTLRCVEDEWTTQGSGEDQTRSLQPFAVFKEEQELPRPEEPLDFLDFGFDLPDGPPTDLGKDEAVYWQVLVEVPLPGPDLETVFLAPVYRRKRR
jgi:hypothetical protein